MIEHETGDIEPLPEDEWDPRLDGVLQQLGPVLNVHRVMARHPELMSAWSPLRQHIATGGSLDPRNRELAILRVAHRLGAEYEWHHHVVRGRAAGLSEAEIEAIAVDSTRGWPLEESTLLSAVDDLIDRRKLGYELQSTLTASIGVEGVMDLIVTVGMYVTLAMFINTTGVQMEDR